jgi:hypothetical protein
VPDDELEAFLEKQRSIVLSINEVNGIYLIQILTDDAILDQTSSEYEEWFESVREARACERDLILNTRRSEYV